MGTLLHCQGLRLLILDISDVIPWAGQGHPHFDDLPIDVRAIGCSAEADFPTVSFFRR